MTTGTDTADDVMGQLAESVERAASLLAGGDRLAGPAAAQDDAADLVPGDTGAGVCLTFADGSIVTVFLVPTLAEELCGGTAPDQLVAGMGPVADAVSTGRAVALADVTAITDVPGLLAALAGRPTILGAGIFDGDAVVATVGAAAGIPGSEPVPAAPTSPEPAAEPTAAASLPDVDASASVAAPANLPVATPAIRTGGPQGVSDNVLARGLALLADVNLDVTAELGRSHLRVSELLGLEPGSVIGLERAAGSPVDLLVNGSLFARAEVIVQDGTYAVRIVELIGTGLTA